MPLARKQRQTLAQVVEVVGALLILAVTLVAAVETMGAVAAVVVLGARLTVRLEQVHQELLRSVIRLLLPLVAWG